MDRRNWLKIGSVGAVGIATSSFSKENWLADFERAPSVSMDSKKVG